MPSAPTVSAAFTSNGQAWQGCVHLSGLAWGVLFTKSNASRLERIGSGAPFVGVTAESHSRTRGALSH